MLRLLFSMSQCSQVPWIVYSLNVFVIVILSVFVIDFLLIRSFQNITNTAKLTNLLYDFFD